MNWLKNQKNRKRKPNVNGTHKVTSSAQQTALSLPTATPPLVNRSQSESAATAVTTPREPTLSQTPSGGHMMLAMCDDFVQSQRNKGYLMQHNALFTAGASDHDHKKPGTRKTTDSFAAQLHGFGDDLAELSYSDDQEHTFITQQSELSNYNNPKHSTRKPTIPNRETPHGSFAAHLSEFAGDCACDLDAIVDAMDTETKVFDENKDDDEILKGYHPDKSYKARFTKYKRNRTVRSDTIVQLKKELAMSESSKKSIHIHKQKKRYKKRTKIYNAEMRQDPTSTYAFHEDEEVSSIASTPPKPNRVSYTSIGSTSIASYTSTRISTTSDTEITSLSPPNYNHSALSPKGAKLKKYYSTPNTFTEVDPAINEWYKYLIAVHHYLNQRVQYFSLIEDIMPSITEQTASADSHAIERVLVSKMNQWIQRYGIPAMISHQEVFELKRNLIKVHEEANNLEEESVQLTQKVFGLESQIQLLNENTQRQENQIEILNQAIQSYKNDIKQLNDRIQELERPLHVASLRLSSTDSYKRHATPPPPPPQQKPHSPSPIPLKQSYSTNTNILNVDEFELDRAQSQPTHHKHRLKPLPPAPPVQRGIPYNMKSLNKSKSVGQMHNVDLLNQNEYLTTELNTLQDKYQRESSSKSQLEIQLAELRRTVSDNGAEPNNSTLNPRKSVKKKKSLINFGRKANSEEINEDLTKVINEMSTQKYVWESEKNAMKEQIHKLTETVKLLSVSKTAVATSDIIDEKDEENEQNKMKSPPWKRGSFGDHLNSFAVSDASGLDGILDAINNEQFDVDHELTENELSQLEYLGDNEEKHLDNIVVTAEIDDYENSDDGWVSEDNITESITSNIVLSQSTTQSITTSSVSTTAPVKRRSAKITKVLIPSNKLKSKGRKSMKSLDRHSSSVPMIEEEDHSNKNPRQSGFNSLLSKFVNTERRKSNKSVPQKKLPPAPTTVIADVKRIKKRFFHPTKHGYLCVDQSNLWNEDIVSQHTRFYVAIDGLPSSTNIDRNESDWKKQKNNDILVPFVCFFEDKVSFNDLMTQTAHKSVRDILFQKRTAQYCNALIRLDTAQVHWDYKTMIKELEIDDDNGNYNISNNTLFIASNVDSDDKQCINIHSFLAENEQSRNQWFSAIQGMIDRRRQSVNRRSVHQNPASGRYKMKLF